MARYEPHDKLYHRARAQGLPSRAAFKLEELLARFKLIREGGRVVDLGCAPGGWLAILSVAVGERGRAVGVDLVACARIGPNVVTLVGDILDPAVRAALLEALGGPADLVTSDLAPKLSGIKDRDEARLVELLEAALTVARDVLKPDGAMVAKVFMGGGFEAARALFAQDFGRCEVVRTRATRPGSSELYLVARDFRGSQPISPSG
ncbi:MAG: RlmE family RNA methyltransferase [Candidatus Binataceae bacterium]